MSVSKTATKKDSKSGLRVLKPSEILFNDGEKANSLFIIQKGQLRLFKPKGSGFIEIAVLRAGEVIGEMAYFDDGGGGKRSCSASAMVTSEVIEISFTAFAKTMEGLNPWFKTIINTLANRLRATNSRVKELESNSSSVNYGEGKHAGYEFFKAKDIIKILGTLYLVYKSHGEKNKNGFLVHKKTLTLYSHEIFGIIESKMDEMIIVLSDIGIMEVEDDHEGLPKNLIIKNLDTLRSYFIFYNTEKHLSEDKKLRIGKKCQTFLENIMGKITDPPPEEDPMVMVGVSDLLQTWEERKMHIGVEALNEAKEYGIVGDVVIMDDESLSVQVNYLKLKRQLPNIKLMNRIKDSNDQKAKF